jgi:hypothetical protein
MQATTQRTDNAKSAKDRIKVRIAAGPAFPGTELLSLKNAEFEAETGRVAISPSRASLIKQQESLRCRRGVVVLLSTNRPRMRNSRSLKTSSGWESGAMRLVIVIQNASTQDTEHGKQIDQPRVLSNTRLFGSAAGFEGPVKDLYLQAEREPSPRLCDCAPQ